MRYSDDDLLTELHELADELGHPPTLQDVREYSDIAATTYYNRFGSWQDALEAAGFEPRDPDSRVPKDNLLADLKRIADMHGSPPAAADMDEHGEYWASTYRRRFGSWNDAVTAAGFDPQPESTPITEETLLEEIRRLADDLDKRPTFRDMEAGGNYSASTYVRTFGSWSAALTEALDD
jgi:hypothetical protein